MSLFRTAAFTLVALGAAVSGTTFATLSMAAGRYDTHDWTINHRAFPTELSRDRATAYPQDESVKDYYAAARDREASKISGSVPGSSWAIDNREAATRRAIAGNHR